MTSDEILAVTGSAVHQSNAYVDDPTRFDKDRTVESALMKASELAENTLVVKMLWITC
jgi:hypothetical protein